MENTKNYLTHWDKFFEDWKKNPKATFDKDEFIGIMLVSRESS